MVFNTSEIEGNLEHMNQRADAAVRVFAEQAAQTLRSNAQTNAIWIDRTGNARTRLHAYVSAMANGYKITLAHGVDYGIWLELAHEKKYSIIPKTIEYVGTFEIMPAFENFMARLGV